jgi:hypothetical protein
VEGAARRGRDLGRQAGEPARVSGTFGAKRWCYLGSIDDWIDVRPTGSVELLAQELIPRLGTDAFFDIY